MHHLVNQVSRFPPKTESFPVFCYDHSEFTFYNHREQYTIRLLIIVSCFSCFITNLYVVPINLATGTPLGIRFTMCEFRAIIDPFDLSGSYFTHANQFTHIHILFTQHALCCCLIQSDHRPTRASNNLLFKNHFNLIIDLWSLTRMLQCP